MHAQVTYSTESYASLLTVNSHRAPVAISNILSYTVTDVCFQSLTQIAVLVSHSHHSGHWLRLLCHNSHPMSILNEVERTLYRV